MKIDVNSTENKYAIHKIDFHSEKIILFTKNAEIALDYAPTTLAVEVRVGKQEMDPMEFLKNVANETSASGTFLSFRTYQDDTKSVCITSIILTLSGPNYRYVIPMGDLLDLLIDTLKEIHPFKHISYHVASDNPDDTQQSEFANKIAASLEKLLAKINEQRKSVKGTSTTAHPTGKKKFFIFIIAGAILLAAVVLLLVRLC
jgi:hypothetical protein